MPILTAAQLTTRLKQAHGTFRATTSSMGGILASLTSFVATNNLSHIWDVHRAIDALPAAKKLRYQVAIQALQDSMPNLYYTPPDVLALGGAGIGIPRVAGTPNHQTDVIYALHALNAIQAGNQLLTALVNQIGVANKRVAIQAWNGSQANECAVTGGMPDQAQCNIALAVEYQPGNAGAAITSCLNNLGHAAGYAWLEAQIDATPIHSLMGVPGNVPSSVTHGAGWLSAAMITAWVNNTAVFPAPLVGQQAEDAKLTLATALFAGSTPAAGLHTIVRWNRQSTSYTNTAGVTIAKIVYISMGHELIHALHNMRGDQPGSEFGTYSRVLYEFYCVGLGPWAGANLTENHLRQSGGYGARVCY